MSENKTKRCPNCGASMKMYWHTLKPGMVRALVKMLKAVNLKSDRLGPNSRLAEANDIRVDKLPEHLSLTHEERCNFQKLRLHALVARVTIDGKVKRGRWLITKKGYEFLKGEEIPFKVLSFRNKVIEHSAEWTTIGRVMKDQESFETVDTIQFEIFEKGNENLHQ